VVQTTVDQSIEAGLEENHY